jgi:hypothetical protein
MAANNRIYYASQGLQLKPETTGNIFATWYDPQGLQSVGITTNFSLQPVFQMGQLELYDLVESVPEVEMTINKVIDGTPPLYAMCMCGENGIGSSAANVNNKQLAELCNNRVSARLSIFNDNQTAVTGTPVSFVDCSGMYLSRFSYSFPIDGNATEEITLVGNNKLWNSGNLYGGGGSGLLEFQPDPNASSGRMPSSPGTIRRANVNLSGSTLPTGTGGLPEMTGTEARNNSTVTYPHIQSITISADLGREAIYELGSMAPYFRYVRFPLEIKSEFTIAGTRGDMVTANDFSSVTGCGVDYKNTRNKTIDLQVCGGTGNYTGTFNLNLGDRNKLTSVNYNGGDTGGGNVNISYSFVTYNKFSMNLTGTYANDTWINNSVDTENYNAFNMKRRDINPEDYLESSSNFANIMDTNKPRRLFRKK